MDMVLEPTTPTLVQPNDTINVLSVARVDIDLNSQNANIDMEEDSFAALSSH